LEKIVLWRNFMNIFRKFTNLIYPLVIFPLNRIRPVLTQPDPASQIKLKITYESLNHQGKDLPALNEVGFKVFSQADEDGILLYIFSIIGTINKRCVEIGAGKGVECNTANLIINHGWYGLLIDGDKTNIKKGRKYYKTNPHTSLFPPVLEHAWITRENVNQVLESQDFKGEIDLLSIDVDGIDYWIWEAIDIVTPRVVAIEYQDIIGPEKALTIPYIENFNATKYPMTNGMPNYCGASLPAMVKLAKKKGYRLVGCNRYGYNAFFIKNSLAQNEIPEISISDCFTHPKVTWGMQERFPTVKDLPWVEV
jgi:hypothetical protein